MKTLFLPDSTYMMMRELVEATAVATTGGLMMMEQVKERHMHALVKMAQSGEICPRHLWAEDRLVDFRPEDVDRCMITFADAQVFCRSLYIDLQPAPATAVGEGADAVGKVWTEERKAEARAYREEHGLKKTAEYYGVSQATISKHIPAGKKSKSDPTPWRGFGNK